MFRRSQFLILPIVSFVMLTSSSVSESQFQHLMKGTLTGIDRAALRIPGDGPGLLDVRAMYYEARDFITPRAPGITFSGRDNKGTLEVSFIVRQVPPHVDVAAGWVLISSGLFASRSDQLLPRGRSGSEEATPQEVTGLILWQKGPEISWVEDVSDLPRYITEQMQVHLNDFLDEWFRDNVS